MMASPVIAGGHGARHAHLAAATRCPAAAPFLLLWVSAPAVAYRLSVPVGAARAAAAPRRARAAAPHGADDVALLRDLRHRGRWWLPPDNFQEGEDGAPGRLARRTSPTNIGMSLLSTLAAHDLGYLPTDRMLRRLDATLRDGREPRALPGASAQLVRHGDAGAAPSALHLHGGQRQSRGRAPRHRRRGCSELEARPQTVRAAARRAGRHGRRAARGVVVDIRRLRHAAGDRGDQQPGAGHRAVGRTGEASDDRLATLTRTCPSSQAAAAELDRLEPAPTPRSTRSSYWCHALLDAVRAIVARTGRRPGALVQALVARMRGPGRRDALRLPLRPAAPHLHDRVPPRRRRRPGPLRRRVLRPAGLGGAAGQLRRDRQGRRAAAPLVPPRPPRHQRRRPRRPDLVGRHDVRVLDAAAPDAELPRARCSIRAAAPRCSGRSTTAASAACRGASRNRPTPSPIARAPINTARSACRGSGCGAGW